MVSKSLRQGTTLTLMILWLAASLIFSGCGSARSHASQRTALGEEVRDNNDSSSTTPEFETGTGQSEGTRLVEMKPASEKSERVKPESATPPGENGSLKAHPKMTDQAPSSKISQPETGSNVEQYPGGIDNSDSASAVDDDIWRFFELADEYHAMGVMANREASWEEAQYYFEKCLKILATLDISDNDSLMTPESVKYSTILDNVISDYRITLRSLGRLEKDANPAVVLERFGSLNKSLKGDSINIQMGEFAEVTYDLPVSINDRVKKSIAYFQTTAHDAFVKYLSRSKRYNGMFRETLAEYDMPLDFVYLSLVESGYNPSAFSWARAMGLWQFISSTGRMYGLNRNWWIDERKDPIKSTHAAARFLKDLYKRFGDWELAMAAYNGGPGRVSRQIKKQKTKDFWKLHLRRQTMDYVPLIYAAAIIAKNPEKYGFYDIEFEDPVVWETMKIDRCLDLKVVAREIGTTLAELKRLNPELLRNYTPPNVKSYTLNIPVGKKPVFLAAYDKMPSPKETSWVKHQIRRGETVSTIAARYGVSQYAILNANNLGRRSKIYAGKKLIVPVPMDRNYNGSSKKKNRKYEADGSIYAVRSGDTMWDIARAFGTSVGALRRINYIERGSRIYVGQALKIPSDAKKFKGKSRSKTKPVYASNDNKSRPTELSSPTISASTKGYKVRAGDTLWDIARMYNITTSTLRRLNNLGRSSRIYPGQILTVSGSGSTKSLVYKVRRGDTLGKIASRHRTSIARILALNGLTDPDNISIGDRLRIN